MFTGIIEEIGIIENVKRNNKSSILTIQGEKIFEDIHIGDSISVNGVCLTVTTFSNETFTADVMNETLNRSSLKNLKNGSYVNLERAMSVNGRLGGHIVSGHIDGTGKIVKIEKDDNAIWYTMTVEENLIKYIVEKGSIAIDGISLTVAKVNEKKFSVSIIPHTAQETILSHRLVGDIVNIENDVIGKYVEKLITFEKSKKGESNITMDLLIKNGF
ncbi:riboflavin synthase [Terrisporobacter mayombei]|uniref:Riboflavin synthase n=1 Tax=Terrisporobacter mayombei TaxID=1541 RepID=A0ABY9Q605_9FIRM|nr:riboflavin synthase [Terrisporobacter mayombei]MCC3870171.1 riboflavin synthase [Terrisporobacter mayombei]WMT82616.1 Riboflavin synthase [Terrisporobacter mayombei]